MIDHLVNWLRTEARTQPGQNRLARWVGRNWARLSYAVHVEPTWLEVNHHDIPVADLPPAFAGLRIAQMSDFHGGSQVSPAYLQEAVELTHKQKPDVIVLTGDFVHKGFEHVERVARVLGHLHCPLGVFAVLGNHDFSVRNALGIRRYRHLHRAVSQALVRHGIRVLQNETHVLQRHDRQLYLTGIEDLWSRVCDPERALANLAPTTPRIVLAHNPCTIERLGSHRCDLMLSGHTHGGQVNLPGLGRVTLGPNGRRYAAGLYTYRDSLLYVNKGVGFGFRVRFGVRPEVAVFNLKAAEPVR